MAVVLFIVVLAGGSAALSALHLDWPVWVVPAVAAVAAALLAGAKPVIESVAKTVVPKKPDPPAGFGGGLDRARASLHRAIELPPGVGGRLSAELPTYVERDVDARLRPWLAENSGKGGFALLVGPAAAGKTRSLYEAIQTTVPGWRLLTPATGAELVDYVQRNGELRRTVIWLDEVQRFLSPDGITVATLRHLIMDRSALAVGTIWRDRFDALTRVPQPHAVLLDAETVENRDFRDEAREILDRLATRFDLEATFSAAELARARQTAVDDPRLAEAIRTGSNVAENLAAAPELIRRWQHGADPFGKAVISAAVFARLCGHPEPIPTAIVEALASAALSGPQRARVTADWFTDALAWAREPVRGTAAPLTAYAIEVGAVDGDLVSDVLVQWARDHRDAVPELDSALAEVRAPQPVAVAGYAGAVVDNGVRLEQQGKSAEAERLYVQAAERGDARAMNNLGVLYEKQGEDVKAQVRYREAARLGNTSALYNLGVLHERQGDDGEALTRYRRAAEAGHPLAMRNLGVLLDRQGSFDEAERWLRKAIDAGNERALFNLGALLERRGASADAKSWYVKAVEAGDTVAMINLGILVRDEGELDAAAELFRRAAEGGERRALVNLGELMVMRGELAEAERWYRRGAAAGDAVARLNLRGLLRRQGRDGEIEV